LYYLGVPGDLKPRLFDTPKEFNAAYAALWADILTPKVTALEEALFPITDPKMEYSLGRSAYQGEEDQFVGFRSARVRLFLHADDFEKMIDQDFAFAIGAVLVVWAYMCFHLGSVFQASVALVQIMCSVPVTALLYKGVFQIDFFSSVHILSVYLVIGVGADDVFVLSDSWKYTGMDMPPDRGGYTTLQLRQRMSIAYHRAVVTVFSTSFTTAMAFISCSVNKVMPMRTFGWFAAICIVVNYILMLMVTPATILVHYRYFYRKQFCCWSVPQNSFLSTSGIIPAPDPDGDSLPMRPGLVMRVLVDYYQPALLYKVKGVKVVAVTIVVVLTGVAIQGAIFTSQLTPPTGPEDWFPATHMLSDLVNFEFDTYYDPSPSDFVLLTFFWGVGDLDRSSFDTYWRRDTPGDVSFAPGLDLSDPVQQQSLLNFCERLRTVKCTLAACQTKSAGTLALEMEGSVGCFLEDMREFHNGTLPTGSEFDQAIKDFRNSARPSLPTQKVSKASWLEHIGIVNGVLKYVAVTVRTSVYYNSATGELLPLRDWLAEVAAPAGDGDGLLESTKFHGSGSLQRARLNMELVNGFLSGCLISGAVALLVLMAATLNWIVGLLATVAVASVVVNVLGFCRSVMDWDLGISEAVAGMIVLGYSVDYVVHLAHMYCEGGKQSYSTRERRVQFAIRNMGTIIFAGAVTTMGASSVLFFCFMVFFFKMGVLMATTIGFSFLFSFGFFMAALAVIGPEDDQGSLVQLFRRGPKEAVVVPEEPVKA